MTCASEVNGNVLIKLKYYNKKYAIYVLNIKKYSNLLEKKLFSM
jgi:hypothetical protein